MTWFKRDCAASRNRKLMLCAKETGLGTKISFLWDELLSINTEKQRNGRLTALDLDPDLTADLLSVWGITGDNVSQAVESYALAGLLKELPGGEYEITGWADYAPPASSTDRSRKRRARPDATDTALHGNGAEVARNGCNALDKTRQDRNTGDKREQTEQSGRETQTPPEKAEGGSVRDLSGKPVLGVSVPVLDKQDQINLVSRFLSDMGWGGGDNDRRAQAQDLVLVHQFDLDTLAKLWKHAREAKGIKSPVALWTKWIKTEKWRDILHEIEKKGQG